jgi:hypothetical protein
MKGKGTYTFVMEFRGGTYCSQLRAFDIEQALDKWTNKLTNDRAEIKYLTLDKLNEVKTEIKNGERPRKLKGLKNIWFTSLLTTKDIIYVNIIKTDTAPSR